MDKKNGIKRAKVKIRSVLKILLIILGAFLAVKIGTIGGDILYKSDRKIISSVDVETFRFTMNNSLPIIDTIYNSGNISMSFSSEIKGLIKDIFHFDLNSPITILTAQSPVFYDYYVGDYQKYITQKNAGTEPYINLAQTIKTESDMENKHEQVVYEEPASSIMIEIDEMDRDNVEPEDEKIVSTGDIKINNSKTNYKINNAEIERLLKEPLKVDLSKKGPKVLIYHTHTTESFIKDLSQLNKTGIQTRTRDERYNVVRVGEELKQQLEKKYNIGVVHNAAIHDPNGISGAYGRSLNTATNILKSYPSIQFVFDIHRDGLNDKKLRVTEKVSGKNAAKVMFVVGTDSTGLKHPNWRENLKLAIKLQKKLNDKYPGLARPIFMSENRYNQHLRNNSLIIEIGGDGNLISECVESSKYVAQVLNELINNK